MHTSRRFHDAEHGNDSLHEDAIAAGVGDEDVGARGMLGVSWPSASSLDLLFHLSSKWSSAPLTRWMAFAGSAPSADPLLVRRNQGTWSVGFR